MLSVEDKIISIIELAEKHHISAYEIGKNTSISSKTAQNILSKRHNNPKHKTLNIILDYTESVIVGKETQVKLSPGIYDQVVKNKLKRTAEEFKIESLSNYSIEEISTYIFDHKEVFRNNSVYQLLIDNEIKTRSIEELQKEQDFLLNVPKKKKSIK